MWWCDVQAAREIRNVARMEAHVARIGEQEQQAASQYQVNVRVRAERDCDARRRENEMQQRKQRPVDMAEQQRVIWRAQKLQ